MKRKIIGLVAVLVVVASVGAFAFEQKSSTYSWMASYNKDGQLNVYVAGGLYYVGLGVAGGVEVALGNFSLAGIPLEWGIEGRGLVGFGSFAGVSWLDWGASPQVTLHWGVDFGGPLKFEWYAGLGLGVYGTTGSYYSYLIGAGPFFGFASSDGVAWHFSENVSLILDYSYTGWTSIYGVGVKLNL